MFYSSYSAGFVFWGRLETGVRSYVFILEGARILLKRISLGILLLFLAFYFASCKQIQPEPTPATTAAQETLPVESTIANTIASSAPTECHSALYIPGLDVEDLILYFNEVCLDAEFVNSGNASLLQRWEDPIFYCLHGSYTEEDMAVFHGFVDWLNTMEGFPGIQEAQDPFGANLQIHFCSQEEMLALMGDHFVDMDGAVTFWYDYNVIYDAIICCRTDLNQTLRNSVILEELYNGLGPIQDTSLRPDSIIYSEYAEPQCLTQIDKLILTLLYHPDLQPGMNAEEVAAVIRTLYY